MNTLSSAPADGTLLFHWDRPRRRKVAIAGFLLASAALHALCFYLFQVVYPPTISLLPPPAQVSVIAPTTAEAHAFLIWLEAEDPALAAQTQRPADARAFQLPRLAHIPSYVAVPPKLKEPPAPLVTLSVPSAMPPGPVALPPAAKASAALLAPTTLVFSDALNHWPVAHPDLKFEAALREVPQAARFRLAVDPSGVVRYVFLEQSSGDAALDAQARRNLALCRFQSSPASASGAGLTWGTASFEFGNDLVLSPLPPERAP